MIIEQEEFQKKLKRINLAYFSDPDRIIAISRGNSVVRQGEQNKRLYLILSGSVVSYRHVVKEDPETASTSHKIYKAFRAGPGDYLGVQSFFSGWFRSSSDLIAETDLELAYIDTTTPAVDVERYGTLLEQFVPAIVHELAARNTRVFDRTAEKEEALRMLHRSEMAATLGQLSAGIAHELNNSLGVLSRKTDFVLETLDNMFRQENAFRYTLSALNTVQSNGKLWTAFKNLQRDGGTGSTAYPNVSNLPAPVPAVKTWKAISSVWRRWRLSATALRASRAPTPCRQAARSASLSSPTRSATTRSFCWHAMSPRRSRTSWITPVRSRSASSARAEQPSTRSKIHNCYSNRQTVRIGGLPVLLCDAAGGRACPARRLSRKRVLILQCRAAHVRPLLHGTARPGAGSQT